MSLLLVLLLLLALVVLLKLDDLLEEVLSISPDLRLDLVDSDTVLEVNLLLLLREFAQSLEGLFVCERLLSIAE